MQTGKHTFSRRITGPGRQILPTTEPREQPNDTSPAPQSLSLSRSSTRTEGSPEHSDVSTASNTTLPSFTSQSTNTNSVNSTPTTSTPPSGALVSSVPSDTTHLAASSTPSMSPALAGRPEIQSTKSKKWIVAPALLIPTFLICLVFLTLHIKRKLGLRDRGLRRIKHQIGIKKIPVGVGFPMSRVKEGVMVSVDVHVDSQEEL